MLRLIILSLCCGIIAGSFVNPYPRFKEYYDGGDPGEPLFLTPFIDDGNLEAGRQKAKVTGELGKVEGYSGYITVNKQTNSNMFFWYFPPEPKSPNAIPVTPIILWLQGGPGASSLFGLFTENGPFTINKDGSVGRRTVSWNKDHHLIYIDNPVGTGFSFANEEGYVRNEVQVGRDLYEAILQIFKLFPELQGNQFYIFGESYAGKYVPALGFKIYKEKQRQKKHGIVPEVKIDLHGIAMGNGLTDPLHQFNYADYLYQIGLIDDNGRMEFQKMQKNGIDCIKKRDMECAFDVFDMMLNMDQYQYGSLFKNLTGYDTYYNYLKTGKSEADDVMGKFLQSSETRRSIHVGNNSFHDLDGQNKVEEHLKKDVMDSVAPWVAKLLDSYRVLVYNGQMDIIVAYPLTVNYLHRLKFTDNASYRNARRIIWKVDNEIAGYVKHGGRLTEVLVRNAGHMSPADQPAWVYDMVLRYTHNEGVFKLI